MADAFTSNYSQPYVPSYGQSEPPMQTDFNLPMYPAKPSAGTPYNAPYNPPAPVNAPSKTDIYTNVGMSAGTVGTGALMAAGKLSGPIGLIILAGIQLIGGLLKAFSYKKPRREYSPEEIEYNNMIQFYRNIGARSKAARAVVSAATGTPVAKLGHIGPDDNTALDMTIDSVRTKTAAKVTGGSR